MVVFSLFRSKKEQDTSSKLEEITKKLKDFKEDRCLITVSKRSVGRKILYYGAALIAIAATVLYMYYPTEVDYLDPEIMIQLTIQFLTVVVGCPLLIYMSRKGSIFYYDRRYKCIDRNIKTLEKEKEGLLENVMENEPYNKARQILTKYKPSLLKPVESPNRETVRKRQVSTTKLELPKQAQVRGQPQIPSPIIPNQRAAPGRVRPTTVRPLPSVDLNTSRIDKIVGWMTGSNPEQMFALICKNCSEHNGLSIKEEFEYLEWRCAYCHFSHQSRKQRPKAPRLQEQRPADRPRMNTSVVEPIRRRSEEIENVLQVNATMPVESLDGLSTRSGSVVSSQSQEGDHIRKENGKEDSGTESDQLDPAIKERSIHQSDEEHSEGSVELLETSVLDETIEACGPMETSAN